MSGKELMYLEDALGHEQFLRAQCVQAASTLQDAELKNFVRQMQTKHEELFRQFYQLT